LDKRLFTALALCFAIVLGWSLLFQKPKPQASRPAGYRVTAHVSKYYDKARI
jgi:hypothetical protein